MHDRNHHAPSAQTNADDDWLDEVLRESFPASDPAPWRHKEDELTNPSEPQDKRSVTPD